MQTTSLLVVMTCVGIGKGMKAVCATRMGTQNKGENLPLSSEALAKKEKRFLAFIFLPSKKINAFLFFA